jgi:hypothetical protein
MSRIWFKTDGEQLVTISWSFAHYRWLDFSPRRDLLWKPLGQDGARWHEEHGWHLRQTPDSFPPYLNWQVSAEAELRCEPLATERLWRFSLSVAADVASSGTPLQEIGGTRAANRRLERVENGR